MDSTYESAWFPFADQAEGVDPTIMAVDHVERLCDERGIRGVVVTHLLRDVATPSLARFAAKHLHVTQRSGGSPQGRRSGVGRYAERAPTRSGSPLR